MDFLYFAWVRERIGTGAETLALPATAVTIADLLDWLAQQSPGHAAALADRATIRVALDEDFVALDAPIAGAREIAIFPPVTGG
ncbi:molybdopterin synthase sulfur carrier subunit [Polymorphobacter glacialis]|uniref:Molybdopterin synthase sulfur carrier subunit n=1 Tax=Sandarakinorhabdus glacialis TaxID=1614636 RepID=A0A917E3I1_9SPHN|nr:molybdopterin converting factor subunit 1 [Polymorphobacter glacialis]GGD99501.1 molybdopterin synthase sulfur carrier subunit [Polymorphobacter glacialis]